MTDKEEYDTFYRFYSVSRETISSLVKYEKLLLRENKKLNLIGKSTIKSIWDRHFLDSAQIIDFIDKNDKIVTDLGSGAGFPGIIIALMAKERKIKVKVKLVEKSRKKSNFLKQIINELNLKVEVINKNIFEDENRLEEDVFVARAFKPIQKILELIHNKADNWKKILLFQGKTGKEELLQASKSWDIKYKQRNSITSSDSLILEIIELKKKIE